MLRQHQLIKDANCGYFCKGPEQTEAFIAIPLLHRPPLLSFSLVSFICDNAPLILVDFLLRQNQMFFRCIFQGKLQDNVNLRLFG